MGFADPRVLGGVAVGVVGLLLFLRRQGRVERPLVNVLRDAGSSPMRRCSASCSSPWSARSSTSIPPDRLGFDPSRPDSRPCRSSFRWSSSSSSRASLRSVRGPPPRDAGYGRRLPGLVGLGIAAINQSSPDCSSPWCCSVCRCRSTMPANTDGMRRVGEGRRGLASGLLQTVRMIGGTLGVATTAVSGGFGVDPVAGARLCRRRDDLLAAAASGDPKAFAALSGARGGRGLPRGGPRRARGIGWGFVVAGWWRGIVRRRDPLAVFLRSDGSVREIALGNGSRQSKAGARSSDACSSRRASRWGSRQGRHAPSRRDPRCRGCADEHHSVRSRHLPAGEPRDLEEPGGGSVVSSGRCSGPVPFRGVGPEFDGLASCGDCHWPGRRRAGSRSSPRIAPCARGAPAGVQRPLMVEAWHRTSCSWRDA